MDLLKIKKMHLKHNEAAKKFKRLFKEGEKKQIQEQYEKLGKIITDMLNSEKTYINKLLLDKEFQNLIKNNLHKIITFYENKNKNNVDINPNSNISTVKSENLNNNQQTLY
ncbi:MAG TPA: hypothetical protein PKY81_09200 [bacterium]|nr:hypothetical protein [bacterium]